MDMVHMNMFLSACKKTENATAIRTRKSWSSHFLNLLLCEHSGMKLPVNHVKTEPKYPTLYKVTDFYLRFNYACTTYKAQYNKMNVSPF